MDGGLPADGAGTAGYCDQRSCPAAGRGGADVAAAPRPQLHQLSGAGRRRRGPDGGTVPAGRGLRPVVHGLRAPPQRPALLAHGAGTGCGGGAVCAPDRRMVAAAGGFDAAFALRRALRRTARVLRPAAGVAASCGAAAGLRHGAGLLERRRRPPCRRGYRRPLDSGTGGYPALRQQRRRRSAGGRYDRHRPPPHHGGHHAGGHHDPADLLLSPGLRGRDVCQQPLDRAGQQDSQ